ncbi:hypothetical protein CCHR01_17228 [Colletotrichum chrysophilum]|uniref:Uncharacterized protein n=1 Tax=Colletotrichum chrysophilum TaxID=1836956 RepID=A0AAD9EA35_9PEZI|nr:hypothetical protein CCHR01_17228 [Colletotrichum chrysophilum]
MPPWRSVPARAGPSSRRLSSLASLLLSSLST